MKSYNDRKALVESALIAGITAMFAISTMYLPILSMLMIFVPVPFLVLSYRNNIRYSILSFITFSLLTGILTEILYSLFLILIFGPIIIAMGYYIKNKRESYVVIGAGAIASILSILIIFQITSYVGGANIIDEIAIVAENIINTQIDMLKGMEVELLSADEILSYLLMIVPGVLMIQSIFITIGNYYLTAAVLKRFSSMDIEFTDFSTFRLPANIVLGSFIIFTLSYLTIYIEGVYHLSLITNVTLLFIFLFFIQGISVVSFLIKKTNTPKAIRILLVGIILLVSPLLTAISFVGLVDSMVDIRKLRTK